MTRQRPPAVPVPLVLGLVLGLALAGCGGGAELVQPSPVPQLTEEGALTVDVLVEGLRGPTQLALHPDGRLLVAEIGEGEGTPTGTVTAIDPDDPTDREVLVAGLDTPTGVTVAGEALWIMERTRLVTAPLAGGPTTTVFADMPSNGRSQGSLTTLADGRLLLDTSGRRQGFDPAPGSGTLWVLDPGAVPAGSPQAGYGTPLLEGMKHAYATAELPDGRLLVTEMSDGRFDGEPAQDELLLIDPAEAPLQGGWPRCVGDQRVVEEFEGDPASCAATVPSLAVFPAGATPTGVAVAPWDPGTVLVTQWTRDQVVSLPLDGAPPVPATVVLDAVPTPQHLLVVGDTVLVSSHTAGQVLSISSS